VLSITEKCFAAATTVKKTLSLGASPLAKKKGAVVARRRLLSDGYKFFNMASYPAPSQVRNVCSVFSYEVSLSLYDDKLAIP
jgi:hypothetical protein